MQWLKINALSSLLFVGLFVFSVSSVNAAAPHVTGKVVNKDTGEGISGMVVKWEDNADAQPDHGGSNGIRYTITQADGTFWFPSWHLPASQGGLGEENLREAEHDKRIDTNYDGNPDKDVVSETDGNFFGCVESPHTFTLMLPRPGMDGSFEPPSIVVDLNNGTGVQNIGNFYYTPVVPQCPGNIRKESCDIANETVTVAWDAPPAGADGYRAYFDMFPYGAQAEGDVLNPDESNQLRRTQKIVLDTKYLLRVKSIRTVDGQQALSESCLAEIICQSDCVPGTPGCGECVPGTPGCGDKPPTATLTGVLCPERPSPFNYEYTLSNINLNGLPFSFSRLMITFTYSAETQAILSELNGGDIIPPSVGFSRWQELNREKRTGDYFGFYVHNYTALPTQPFILNDATNIGNTTIGEFRQFLTDNNLPTQYPFKANMATSLGANGILFNSHIPAGTINLALSQNAVCANECVPGDVNCPVCVPGDAACTPQQCTEDVVITQPGVTFLSPDAQNKITVTWTSAASQFEVILFNKEAFGTAAEAFLAKDSGADTLLYFTTSAKSQVFDLDNIKGSNLGVGVRAIAIAPNCQWFEKDVPLGFKVSGNFYVDDQCVSTANPAIISGQISSGGQTVPLNNQSSYQIDLPYDENGHDITLQIGGEEYICSTQNAFQCPVVENATTCRIENVDGPASDKHFYVQTRLSQFNSWWQVRGGLVFSNQNIISRLPIDSDNQPAAECVSSDCEPFLVRREYFQNQKAEKSAGVPILNLGSFGSEINGWWTHRANDNRTHAEGTPVLGNGDLKEDYQYFQDLLTENVTAQTSPGTITDVPGGSATVADAQVWHFTGDLTVRPSNTWTVSNKQVILVNGNIRFETSGDEQVTQVNPGGFLAFIASGDITFDNEIGANSAIVSDTTPNIEGIFIADKKLIVEGNGAGDKKFIGAGTFVGWEDVVLQRRFDNPSDENDIANQLKNTNMPVESFFFRSDFTVNTPEFMRSSSYTWKEVN